MRLFVLFFLLVTSSAATAATITIDFSDPTLPSPGTVEGFETDGFAFTFASPFDDPFYTGGRVAFCPGCDMFMENANGDTFSFYSFEAQGLSDPGVISIEVTGYLEGGGTLFESVPIDSTSQLIEINWDGLIRVEFNPTESVEFGSYPTIIDNITVSAVPIPAAAWLFGSALLGLGWMGRKPTV